MASFTWDGDFQAAHQWYPFAVTEITSMQRLGIAVKTITPDPDVTIMMQSSPFHIHIIAGAEGSIYLESGFLYLGSIAKCNDETYKPAILKLETGIINYLSTTSTPMEGKGNIKGEVDSVDEPYSGEVLDNGQQSVSVGGTELSTEVTDQCGNEYFSPFSIYSYTEIWVQKICQRYVPSSLYSGKMRLFIQALYGSERLDYSMPLFGEQPLPKSTDYYLILNDINDEKLGLRNDIQTAGLFTSSTYDYYIVVVLQSNVSFYPLLLSSVAKTWQTTLIALIDAGETDEYFISRIEAYILSTATVDMNLQVAVSTGLDVAGLPFGYGFKFNKMGNECKCIFHENIDDNKFQPNLVTINFNDDLTITASVVPRGEWSNGTALQTWYPDHFDRVMKGFGGAGLFYTQSANVPLYGYYVDDVFKEFIIDFSSTNQAHSDVYQVLTSSNFTGYGFDSPVDANQEIINSGGSSIHFGTMAFSFDGESKSFRVEDSHNKTLYEDLRVLDTLDVWGEYYSVFRSGSLMREGLRFRRWLVDNFPPDGGQYGWVMHEGPTDASTSFTLTTDFDGNGAPIAWNGQPYPFGGYKLLDHNVNYGTYDRKFENAFHVKVLFAVPFDDCEAIVYGWNEIESWVRRFQGDYTTEALLNTVKVRTSMHTGDSIINSTQTGEFQEYDVEQVLVPGQAQNQGIKNNIVSGSGGNQNTEVKYHTSAKTSPHFQNNDGFIIKSDNSGEVTPLWADKYFSYGDGFGPFHPKMIARASANGASLLLHDINEDTDGDLNNGFPNDNGLLNSSAGWN